MTTRLRGLTGATLPSAPTVCHDCVFWQSRPGRTTSKRKWIERAEDDWGAWGTVYADDDGRVLGSMQYGPSELFPRAASLPAGPPDEGGGLVPVEEKAPAKLLRRVREVLEPEPEPVPRRP